MPLIEPGKKAPAFTRKDQTGKKHRLSQYAGRPVILYFYPKDDTPGCTKEACAFQASLPRFKTRKAIVRTTYLIGSDGKVQKRWDKVKVDGHADEVLSALS
jgi:peroxiredoxin